MTTAPFFARGRGTSIKPSRVLIWLTLAAVTCVMLYPIAFMIDYSLHSPLDNGAGRSAASWRLLLKSLPVGRQLANSMLVTAAAIAIIVAVGAMAGFAFAKLAFRGRSAAYLLVLSCLLVPMQSIIIPEYTNLSRVGLTSGYLGAILVYAALGIPFATFLFTTYFKGLPDEVIEAALIDGLSYRRIFISIGVPLAIPAIVTVTVLQFIQIWDDLLVGLLFLQNPADRTITVGLAVLQSGHTTNISVLMAGSFLSALPAIVVYLIFQKYLVRALMMGMGK
jgi:ABC-type glycerol-3-phosphate transport system permease component